MYSFAGLLMLASAVSGKFYLKEQFTDGWKARWTESSDWKPAAEMGEWGWTAGEHHGDVEDKGIKTMNDARFYGLSAPLSESFTNEDKEMVIQFTVKHEQNIDCGGAYIKLLPDMDQSKFSGDTPYQVMFGPDICGPSNRRTHVIFNYPPRNDNLLVKNEVKVETDVLTHVYSLVVKPDGTYEVFIDLESVRSGKLEEDFDFLLPKEIKDPAVSKPSDWVDAKKIPDPEDIKPADWDDIPEKIPDPDAAKPDDWDEDEDGEYEPPMIPNPDYQGEWSPKMIDNPDYKGEWEHPMIPNPDYEYDENLYQRVTDATHVGFELWQVKAGTIFDDIVVTDSWAEAKAFAEEVSMPKKKGEKESFDEAEEEKKKKEEEERAAREAEEAEDEDEEEEEEDEGNDEL